MSIAALAASVARAAGLGDWLASRFKGTPGARAASRILALAQDITGAPSAEQALAVIRDDAGYRDQVAEALRQASHELLLLDRQDRADARAMYLSKSATADRLAHRIMAWNLPAVVALVGANCAAVYFVENPTVAVALGNVIGASITYLWQERSQVVGFFFGSSVGSKDKQEQLAGRPS